MYQKKKNGNAQARHEAADMLHVACWHFLHKNGMLLDGVASQ
jgi:hypothetical protein